MTTMAALTTRQRQFLKGVAHPLSPVVRIGKAGLTDAVLAETHKALESHEVIKVRIEHDEGAQRKDLAARLAAAAEAHLVTTVGKIAILFRAREEDSAIKLPK